MEDEISFKIANTQPVKMSWFTKKETNGPYKYYRGFTRINVKKSFLKLSN